jgi:hypothetical protein
MKTAREVLLARHRDAAPELDRIRQAIVGRLSQHKDAAPAAGNWLPALWQQLVLPSRYAWAGIAATWIALLAFNGLCPGGAQRGLRRDPVALSRVTKAIEERQQFYATVTGPTETREGMPAPQRVPSARRVGRREEVGIA